MAGMPDPTTLSQGGFPTRAGLTKLGQAVATVAKERVVDPVVNTARGVQNIMTGQTPMYAADETGRVTFNPEVVGTTNDVALGMMGGSGMVGAKQALREGIDPSRLGMFFGPMARTADKKALATARFMDTKGAPREEIFDTTGWFKGRVDDKWRFEVPDTGFDLPDDIKQALYKDYVRGRASPRMGDLFSNLPTFEAYPQLRDLTLGLEDISSQARANSKGIQFDRKLFEPIIQDNLFAEKQGKGFLDPERRAQLNQYINQVLLHEIQHPIQKIENFGPGANIRSYDRDLAMREALASTYEDPIRKIFTPSAGKAKNDEALARMRAIPNPANPLSPSRAERYYDAVSGEAEARNVETRFLQGYAKRPWETLDVPEEKQFLSFR